MKFKKIVMSIMGIGLSLNLVGVSPAYATDNPLKDSQEKEQENLKKQAQKEDISNKADENQPFSIKDEAYSIYASSKESFNNLQMQYGHLDGDSQAGQGFKSYLKIISEDKENQQLKARLNQMAQGDYSVSVSADKYDSLKDAVEGVTDEQKEAEMNSQEDEEEKGKDSQVMGADKSDDYNSDIAFGSGYQSYVKQYTNKYEQNKKDTQDKSDEVTSQQTKEFGKSKDNSQSQSEKDKQEIAQKDKENKESIQRNYNEQFNSQKNENNQSLSKNEKANEKFLESGKNKSILKSYNQLKNAIVASQKAVSNAGKSASASKSYENKVKNIIAKSN